MRANWCGKVMAPNDSRWRAAAIRSAASPSGPPTANASALLPSSRIRASKCARPSLLTALPAASRAIRVSALPMSFMRPARSWLLRLSADAAWLSAISPHSTGVSPSRRPEASRRSRYFSNSSRSGPSLRRPTAAITTRMTAPPIAQRQPGPQCQTQDRSGDGPNLVGGGIARALGRPHLFEIVELPHLRPEHVHDDVAGVNQDPVALRLALNAGAPIARVLELVLELLGDRAHMPVGAAGGDHHVVADGGLPFDIDRHNVLGFCFIERRRDDRQKGLRAVFRRHEFGWRRARASTLKGGWHLVLMVLSSSIPRRAPTLGGHLPGAKPPSRHPRPD